MKEKSGYIFEENGKWYARVTFTDSHGKRRNIKRTAESKSKAKQKLKEILRQLEDEGESAIVSERMTFADLADYYEANYVKPAKFVDGRKVEGLRDIKHVKSFVELFRAYFGKKKLRDITYGDVMVFRALRLDTPTQRKKPRTITTVNRELSSLRRIFNIALRQGWITKNPFNLGDPLIDTSAERKRERILTFEEEARILAACEKTKRCHLKPLIITLLDTGARKGETLKLVWRDIDFDRRVITFQAMNTKTLQTRRVAMTSRLFNLLQDLWQKSSRNPESRIFDVIGDIRKSFSSVCKEVGIKVGGVDGLTPHNLRHSAAVRLVKGQIPIQLVGRILGHTRPETTYRYLSVNEETLYEAASTLDDMRNKYEKKSRKSKT